MENKEVYTIWQGAYSDKDVIAVAYDKKIAKAYAKLHDGYVDTAPIITDENYIQRADAMIVQNEVSYEVYANRKGWQRTGYSTTVIEEKDRKEDEIARSFRTDYMYITLYFYGEYTTEQLLKMANDKLMKILAEEQGL